MKLPNVFNEVRGLHKSRQQAIGLVLRLLVAGIVFYISRLHDLWWLAALLVVAIEGGEAWRVAGKFTREAAGNAALAVVMGLSVVMVIALSPREATQIVVALGYALWRWWWRPARICGGMGMINLWSFEAAAYWAVFLMSAVWRTDEWLILTLAWAASYIPVFLILNKRGERTAAVLAASWAVVAVEISWVLVRWLFVYTVAGGYLLVPQATLVLTALAYCFGSIYMAQREGNLSRSRLTEYILIGLILIAIVVTGTPWRGSL